MKTIISARLPEMTIEQIEMLKRYYELDELTGDRFSTSRILIICINFFWKHMFESKTNTYLDEIKEQVLAEFNKTTGEK